MICLISEEFRMVDPVMLEFRYVQHVIGAECIGTHDAVGHDLVVHNNRLQYPTFGIWDHLRIHLAATLEKAEDRHFSGRTPPPVTFASATEVALVNFYLSSKWRFILGCLRNNLSQAMKVLRRGAFIDPDKRGGCSLCHTDYKVFDQALLFCLT